MKATTIPGLAVIRSAGLIERQITILWVNITLALSLLYQSVGLLNRRLLLQPGTNVDTRQRRFPKL